MEVKTKTFTRRFWLLLTSFYFLGWIVDQLFRNLSLDYRNQVFFLIVANSIILPLFLKSKSLKNIFWCWAEAFSAAVLSFSAYFAFFLLALSFGLFTK